MSVQKKIPVKTFIFQNKKSLSLSSSYSTNSKYMLFCVFFCWACLCLNSISAPDAFLDILSQEIIRFFTPSGYQSRASI